MYAEYVVEYKCPCCGGAIAFDKNDSEDEVPYCDSEFEMETLQAMDEQLKEGKSDSMGETKAGGEWQEGETDGLSTYVCQSCGGEIVGDATMAAKRVRFVTIRLFSREKFAGVLRPDLVIPFKLDKKAAKEGLMKHISGKRLLPKVFKDQNHIDEIKVSMCHSGFLIPMQMHR